MHDPRSSLRTGDIISISSGFRVSKTVHHVVNEILAPFGEPIEARPAVPTEAERIAVREERRAAKLERKRLLAEALARGEVPEVQVVEKKKEVLIKPSRGQGGKGGSGKAARKAAAKGKGMFNRSLDLGEGESVSKGIDAVIGQ